MSLGNHNDSLNYLPLCPLPLPAPLRSQLRRWKLDQVGDFSRW